MSIFYLPDLGEGLSEAEIREWHVKVGDVVEADQTMISVETAKAVVDIPAPHAGTVKKLFGNVGDFIKTSAPLIDIETFTTAPEKSEDKGTVVGKLTQTSVLLAEETRPSAAQTTSTSVKALPQARKRAAECGVNLQNIAPTRADGVITVDDVENALSYPAEAEPLRGLRRAMCQTMTLAHAQVVPATLIDEVLLTHTKDMTVRLIQAMVFACQQEPSLNVRFDGKTLSRTLLEDVNLGLAIDTDEGLMVPVIAQAHHMDAQSLRKKIDQLKKSAQARQLDRNDLENASITLSNIGMFAGLFATPVVVPPSVAIVAAGRLREWGEQTYLPLSLTFDHRAVTGGEAARFLKAMMTHLQR